MRRLEFATSRHTEAIDITHLFSSRTWPDGILVASVEHTTAAHLPRRIGLGDVRRLRARGRRPDRAVRAIPPRDLEPRQCPVAYPLELHGHAVALAHQPWQLDLGTWQRVIFLELDGPRRRRSRSPAWPASRSSSALAALSAASPRAVDGAEEAVWRRRPSRRESSSLMSPMSVEIALSNGGHALQGRQQMRRYGSGAPGNAAESSKTSRLMPLLASSLMCQS